MNVSIIQEPELEFALQQRHVDVRFGLMDYGVLDQHSRVGPRLLRIGLVGTDRTVEAALAYFAACRSEIPPKPGHLDSLFPPFPGIAPDHTFYTELITDSSLQRRVPNRVVRALAALEDIEDFVTQAARQVIEHVADLAEQGRPDVVFLAMPEELRAKQRELRRASRSRKTLAPDLHDTIKALALALRVPLQFAWEPTFDPTVQPSRSLRTGGPQLQDEATRAWNLFTALYYKAGGIPYRLARDPSALDTCYVGVSFFRSLDGTQVNTSMAQVFNQRGEGVVVLGGPANIDKSDRQVHLAEADAYQLLFGALETYRREHKNLPARVVVHKTSLFNAQEDRGFDDALMAQRIETADFVALRSDSLRLFRHGQLPPIRGTYWEVSPTLQILYTRGSIPFYRTYPGMYVPRTLRMRTDRVDRPPMELAKELLALTKLNFNDTQLDGSAPMTVRAARHVAAIAKCVPTGGQVPNSFRFYM